jgi:hypothetical protein
MQTYTTKILPGRELGEPLIYFVESPVMQDGLVLKKARK